jgi:hypothetical protein
MTDSDRVLRLLANASATQEDIAKACHLPVRSVQAAIQELRLAGQPIITDPEGSWRGMRLARDADEAMACAVALRRRLATQYLTYRALRGTARRMYLAERKPPEVEAPEGSLWRIAS